jgi:hypothetical protein
VVELFIDAVDLAALGFAGVRPSTLLKIYL